MARRDGLLKVVSLRVTLTWRRRIAFVASAIAVVGLCFLIRSIASNTSLTLTSPADASYLSEGQAVTFSWSGTGSEYSGVLRGVPGGTVAFGWQSGTTYTFTPSSAGYTLYWEVKARKGGIESAWSSTREAYVVPAAPTNLVGQVLACDQIRLSWTDNSNVEDSFQVYRDGVFIGSSGNLGANVTTVTLSAASNATHAYTVKAGRGIYPSAPSNSVPLTTPACVTAPPTARASSRRSPGVCPPDAATASSRARAACSS